MFEVIINYTDGSCDVLPPVSALSCLTLFVDLLSNKAVSSFTYKKLVVSEE